MAPPPKATTPRRSNNLNGSQDLFGADPFAPITKPFNVSIQPTLSSDTFLFFAIKSNLNKNKQEFNGLDYSTEPRTNAQSISTLSHQMNRFDDDLSDNFGSNDFQSKDSTRNPFLVQKESPKKSTVKLFQKSEMILTAKSNKYDVFKNEAVNAKEVLLVPPPSNKAKNDDNTDLFKDFAVAAFSEFKVDKTSSMIHEFSNRLSDQKNLSNGHTAMKVNSSKLQTHVNVWNTTNSNQ